MTTGRNFDEVLRVIDSLQLTATQQLATPAQWQPGDDVIISGAVSNDAGQRALPGGLGRAAALDARRQGVLSPLAPSASRRSSRSARIRAVAPQMRSLADHVGVGPERHAAAQQPPAA